MTSIAANETVANIATNSSTSIAPTQSHVVQTQVQAAQSAQAQAAQATCDFGSMLNQLCGGQTLTEEQSKGLFAEIFQGKINPIQLASLLTALKIKGEQPSEIAGAAMAMLDAAERFPRPALKIGEIVGTGGDHANSINISTITAIMGASLGLNIAKHGNRAVSSKTGASDLLAALGYNINCAPEVSAYLLANEGFAFIFAQHYHKAMRFAADVRQNLKTRTIFNLLGPLTNPVHPDYELLGVYDPALLTTMANTLSRTTVERAFCVNGNGLDEIAPYGQTAYAELKDGQVTTGVLTKESFGITADFNQAQLEGGEPAYNAQIAYDILSGKGNDAHNAAIGVNLAALLYLGDKADSLKQGFTLAQDALKSGLGLKKLERICAITQQTAASA